MDIFSLPEMTLLSCVNEYFLKNNIDYEPVHLYKDVKVLDPPHLIAISCCVLFFMCMETTLISGYEFQGADFC